MNSFRFCTLGMILVTLVLVTGCPQNSKTSGDQQATQSEPATDVYTVAEPQPPVDQQQDPSDDVDVEISSGPKQPAMDIPDSWTRLSPEHEIWLDLKTKQVMVGGQICFRAGPLEMLICPRDTKEHESVISANVESWQVHAALVRAGISQGEPCKWDPKYQPAWGPNIDIEVMWMDAQSGQLKRIDGKQWVTDIDTGKPMTHNLVFAGSIIDTDPDTGQNYYTGNSGPLVCLANFATSTIDLRIEDPDSQAFFEANTSKIPPLGAQVYAVLRGGQVLGKPVKASGPADLN